MLVAGLEVAGYGVDQLDKSRDVKGQEGRRSAPKLILQPEPGTQVNKPTKQGTIKMMMEKFALRSRFLLAGAAMSALLLAGAPAFAVTPADTLVEGFAIDDIISMDPGEAFELSTAEVTGNTYDLLVRLDLSDTSKVKGDLAESWTVADDGMTYTFKLKSSRFSAALLTHLHGNARINDCLEGQNITIQALCERADRFVPVLPRNPSDP